MSERQTTMYEVENSDYGERRSIKNVWIKREGWHTKWSKMKTVITKLFLNENLLNSIIPKIENRETSIFILKIFLYIDLSLEAILV